MTPPAHAPASKADAWPRLTGATAALVYLSETEAPFHAVQAALPTAAFEAHDARHLAGRGGEERVEEQSLADFFSDFVRSEDWHGPDEAQAVERYRALHRLFCDWLGAPKVFRIGEVRVTILIVGRTSDGHWIGARTEAVET